VGRQHWQQQQQLNPVNAMFCCAARQLTAKPATQAAALLPAAVAAAASRYRQHKKTDLSPEQSFAGVKKQMLLQP
jgi:hypothetical protein